jgi:hypothetical protein
MLYFQAVGTPTASTCQNGGRSSKSSDQGANQPSKRVAPSNSCHTIWRFPSLSTTPCSAWLQYSDRLQLKIQFHIGLQYEYERTCRHAVPQCTQSLDRGNRVLRPRQFLG